MFERIGEKVGVAVFSAVILGALALIWNFATSGGLVRSLGGVPKAELPAMIKGILEASPNLRGPEGPQGKTGASGLIGAIGIPGSIGPAGPKGEDGTDAEFPTGAVVAFDVPFQCPEGWSAFREGQSRTIIGATTGSGFAPGLQNNEASRPLIEYKYRAHGGVETVTLKEAQMPAHDHTAGFAGFKPIGGGASRLDIQNPDTSGYIHLPYFLNGSSRVEEGRTDGVVDFRGDDQPHNNMPPYIALYFCKKD